MVTMVDRCAQWLNLDQDRYHHHDGRAGRETRRGMGKPANKNLTVDYLTIRHVHCTRSIESDHEENRILGRRSVARAKEKKKNVEEGVAHAKEVAR